MGNESYMTIRFADSGDVKQIAEIEKICFSHPWSEEDVRREIEVNKVAAYIVAEMEGIILGYVGCWYIVDEGHITNVAVRPEFRGRYIGTALVSKMMEMGTKAGVSKYTLEVRASNEAAKTLYRNMGFVEADIRKGYYTDSGEDGIIMVAETSLE